MSKDKREAREFCFQYFFHLQLPVFEEFRKSLNTDSDTSEIKSSIDEYKESTNTLLSEENAKFVLNTVVGTLKNYEQIEDLISKKLKNWKLDRISKVDHTNLLLSTYELCFDKKTPANIVINEAIEISKKFGNKDSGAFINGVLDKLSKE